MHQYFNRQTGAASPRKGQSGPPVCFPFFEKWWSLSKNLPAAALCLFAHAHREKKKEKGELSTASVRRSKSSASSVYLLLLPNWFGRSCFVFSANHVNRRWVMRCVCVVAAAVELIDPVQQEARGLRDAGVAAWSSNTAVFSETSALCVCRHTYCSLRIYMCRCIVTNEDGCFPRRGHACTA